MIRKKLRETEQKRKTHSDCDGEDSGVVCVQSTTAYRVHEKQPTIQSQNQNQRNCSDEKHAYTWVTEPGEKSIEDICVPYVFTSHGKCFDEKEQY